MRKPWAMVHALGGARGDRSLWREAVTRDFDVLQHAPDAIRSDRAFMEALVLESPRAMRHALGGVRDDRALWREAATRDSGVFTVCTAGAARVVGLREGGCGGVAGGAVLSLFERNRRSLRYAAAHLRSWAD